MAIDPQGRIVEINSAGREILRPAGDAAGVPLEDAFGKSEFTEKVRSAVEQKIGLQRLELRVKDQTIGLTTVPLLGEQQQFLGVLALFTDLTHIRDLESRVRELQLECRARLGTLATDELPLLADDCLWGLAPHSRPSRKAQFIHRLLSANLGNRGSRPRD